MQVAGVKIVPFLFFSPMAAGWQRHQSAAEVQRTAGTTAQYLYSCPQPLYFFKRPIKNLLSKKISIIIAK
jgi:hypothetical protein